MSDRDIVERLRAGCPGCSRIECEAADKIESLRAEIARLREERRWIPVDERLPELNEANRFHFNGLVSCSNGNVCEMTYEINTYAKHERHRQPRWKWHGAISIWEVTHWQPLPPGPEGDG